MPARRLDGLEDPSAAADAVTRSTERNPIQSHGCCLRYGHWLESACGEAQEVHVGDDAFGESVVLMGDEQRVAPSRSSVSSASRAEAEGAITTAGSVTALGTEARLVSRSHRLSSPRLVAPADRPAAEALDDEHGPDAVGNERALGLEYEGVIGEHDHAGTHDLARASSGVRHASGWARCCRRCSRRRRVSLMSLVQAGSVAVHELTSARHGGLDVLHREAASCQSEVRGLSSGTSASPAGADSRRGRRFSGC